MTTAEIYRDELVPQIEEMVVSGFKPDSAIAYLRLASEESFRASVLKSWLYRKHEDEASLMKWAANRAAEIDKQTKKFAPLAEIITKTPLSALDRAVVPQLTDWHKWIVANAWDDPSEKGRALAFAKNEIWKKRAAAAANSSSET